MAIQYAGGTIVNATTTQSAGTRAELAAWVKDQLVVAGWTVAVTAANDWKLNSAATPQGLQMRVRIYDPGSGNCARIKPSNVAESRVYTNDLFLLPAVGKTWRIVANRHQFFVFTASVTTPREFACGMTPYLPSFLSGVTTEAIHGHANSSADGDTTLRTSFRNNLFTQSGGGFFCTYNASAWSDGAGTAPGFPRLLATGSPTQSSTFYNCYRWSDDSLQVYEPLISWGLTGPPDEGKIRGQVWDAVMVSDGFAPDATISLDGRTFLAVTGNNGASNATNLPGTLFVAVT